LVQQMSDEFLGWISSGLLDVFHCFH
jgi:hypothetical protein